MQFLVNHQLFPIVMQPKSTSIEQIYHKGFQGNGVTSLHCLLLSTSKNKDLKKISKSAANVVLAFKFFWTAQFAFPLWHIKINNLIALRSANHFTEISAPWWLIVKCEALICKQQDKLTVLVLKENAC